MHFSPPSAQSSYWVDTIFFSFVRSFIAFSCSFGTSISYLIIYRWQMAYLVVIKCSSINLCEIEWETEEKKKLWRLSKHSEIVLWADNKSAQWNPKHKNSIINSCCIEIDHPRCIHMYDFNRQKIWWRQFKWIDLQKKP